MIKIRKSKYIIVIFTCLIFGFLFSQSIVYPKLKEVESISFNTFSNGVCDANIQVKIKNDNWFSYRSSELNTEIYYKEHLIALGTSESQAFIRKSDQSIDFKSTIFLDSLNYDFYNLLSQDSIELKIKVTGKFSFLRIKKSVEINTKISSKEFVFKLIYGLMKDEGVKVQDIKLKSVNKLVSNFDLNVIFKNKLPFDVILSKLNIVIYSDPGYQIKVGNWSIEMNKLIPENNSELINGEASINNLNATLSGILKVVSGDFNLYCKGVTEVNVENYKIKIPLLFKFKFNPLSQEVFIEQ